MSDEKISALLDDELSEHECAAVLRDMRHDPHLRATWERYHIIRSSIRRELADLAPPDLAERIALRVAAETPSRGAFRGRSVIGWPMLKTASALAIAASVAVVAVLTVRPSIVSEPAPMTAALSSRPPSASPGATDPAPKAVASARDNALNAMLVKHGEFSPTVGMSGLAPYVRVVGQPGN